MLETELRTNSGPPACPALTSRAGEVCPGLLTLAEILA
jgi:hypothetical protein